MTSILHFITCSTAFIIGYDVGLTIDPISSSLLILNDWLLWIVGICPTVLTGWSWCSLELCMWDTYYVIPLNLHRCRSQGHGLRSKQCGIHASSCSWKLHLPAWMSPSTGRIPFFRCACASAIFLTQLIALVIVIVLLSIVSFCAEFTLTWAMLDGYTIRMRYPWTYCLPSWSIWYLLSSRLHRRILHLCSTSPLPCLVLCKICSHSIVRRKSIQLARYRAAKSSRRWWEPYTIGVECLGQYDCPWQMIY